MTRYADRRRAPIRAPREVVGYHGCSAEASALLTAGEAFVPSSREYDWLGRGVYFWEYGPFRALDWARSRFGSQGVVLEANILLGRCLNLLDVEHSAAFGVAYDLAMTEAERKGVRLLDNLPDGRYYLDRFMVEFYCELEAETTGLPYQTVRGCYPEGPPVFPQSRILSQTHVQIAVRDPSCLASIRLVDFG
jgi:hypothetical protein